MEKTFETIKDFDLKIFQPSCGYRYNEDSFLLINFIKNIKKNSKVIELCAGSGIIGLALLKIFPNIKLTFVEIEKLNFEILCENIKINNLDTYADAILSDYRKLDKKLYCTFDVVVANPPYRKPNTGRISPNNLKAKARHELEGSLTDFFKISSLLLKDKGKIFIIFLAERLIELINIMTKFMLEPKKIQLVYPDINKECNLILIEAIKKGNSGVKILPPLYKKSKTL